MIRLFPRWNLPGLGRAASSALLSFWNWLWLVNIPCAKLPGAATTGADPMSTYHQSLLSAYSSYTSSHTGTSVSPAQMWQQLNQAHTLSNLQPSLGYMVPPSIPECLVDLKDMLRTMRAAIAGLSEDKMTRELFGWRLLGQEMRE